MPIKWIRPSGTEIETSDSKATIEAAARLGWKRVGPSKENAESKPKESKQSKKGKN